MRYEIVQFRNNKFGIRRRNFFENLFNYGGDYYDFESACNYFWEAKSNCFYDCQTKDIEVLFETHSRLKNDYVLNTFKNGLPNN